VAAISERILELTDLICQNLAGQGGVICSHREGEHRSGIVSFEVPGRNPVAVRKRCLAQGVVLSCRAGKLRVSPHAYCNEEDVGRLMRSLRGE
jgi:cysteine desulfurase/selenocysteine lyase